MGGDGEAIRTQDLIDERPAVSIGRHFLLDKLTLTVVGHRWAP
jgi:hypothetical protein